VSEIQIGALQTLTIQFVGRIEPILCAGRSTNEGGRRNPPFACDAHGGLRRSGRASRRPVGSTRPTKLLRGACKDNSMPRVRQSNPTGKSAKSCPPLAQKIFPFRRRANHRYKLARLDPTRGALAIVTKRGAGCGGRGCAFDERHGGGRRSRVVLASRAFPELFQGQIFAQICRAGLGLSSRPFGAICRGCEHPSTSRRPTCELAGIVANYGHEQEREVACCMEFRSLHCVSAISGDTPPGDPNHKLFPSSYSKFVV